jgi:ribosomal protein S18 acetylase RimI-like enzyme
MMPDAQTLYAVVEATWPPAATRALGAFTLRDGQGGGKRVSAATALRSDWTADDILAAEQAMREMSQTPLFMLRDGEDALDAALDERGYAVVDPVVMYAAPVADLAANVPPRVSTFAVWEPLAISYQLWQAGGIGPGRWQVMQRAKGPKTSILGRWNDSPGGTGFCAIHDGIAMVHALEVAPHQRRQGMAEKMMAQAAIWAAKHGASHISVVCTQANDAANGLYRKLGMTEIGRYHYRQKD